MSETSQKRRAARRAALGTTETPEDRRARLREDPAVQALVAEALRNQGARVMARLKEADGMAAAVGILVARLGGKVVLSPAELQAAKLWSLQFLPQIDGHLVMHVIRDEHDMAAAQMRESAVKSGLVLP